MDPLNKKVPAAPDSERSPSTNVDPVKLTYNWEPSNLSVDLSKVYYEVLEAKTNELLFSSAGKIAIAHFLGKTLNQVKDYLDHEKSIWVPALQCEVFIRTGGITVPLRTGPVSKSWVATEPVKFIDIASLPDNRIYLYDKDRQITEYVFNSSAQAAWALDEKSEYQYINQC